MNHFYSSIRVLSAPLLILLGLISLSPATFAQNGSNITISSDVDAETVDRFSKSDVVRFITNSDESVNLMVAQSGIAIQFSDKFLNDLDDEILNSKEENSETSAFEDVIRSMVGSGVRTLLDRAILIPFYELSSVNYDNGRIHVIDINGEDIFEDLEINDKQIMEDFSRRDSRRFVADAEKRLI